MRHIPDDELHAYLDQALSRSQAIEIETHIARCAACRDARDETAALRDRTTLLLAGVGPRLAAPPPWAQFMARAEQRRRTSWRRLAVVAAGLAGAMVAGWGMRAMLDPHTPAGAVPAVEVASAESAPEPGPLATLPVPGPATEPAAPPSTSGVAPVPQRAVSADPAGVQFASNGAARPTAPIRTPAPGAALLTGLGEEWETRSRDEALDLAGGIVPELPGLPVTAIRLRPAAGPERPLLVVTQELPDGQLVYTVEGPVDVVAELVALQARTNGLRASDPTRSSPDYVAAGGGYRRTPRVVATLGVLSADSLNALVQRVRVR